MHRFKLTALAAATATVACVPLTPAAAAGPLIVPWALGHLIGAAARLATLPIIAASAASSAGPPVPPVGSGTYYASPGYYAPPAYYGSAGYYAPRGYASPGYYSGAYNGSPQRYYPASAYRGPAPYVGAMQRYPAPNRGYYAPAMRYSGSYGGPGFSRSRGFTYRRW